MRTFKPVEKEKGEGDLLSNYHGKGLAPTPEEGRLHHENALAIGEASKGKEILSHR